MAKTSGQGARSEGPKENYADRFPGGVPLHPGDMVKWDKIGQEMIGVFLNIKEFRNGYIAQMDTEEDGRVAFSAPTILADILLGLKKGSRVAIVFSGEKPATKAGLSPTKEFEVYQLPDAD
jgi:hypothetical protein